ncbi:hypothetical protein [Microcoleus sp. D3_18_C4]|uniref:hypothetical protein n=1 Tax=Microcoleus sp. D3_18_C4 TaxID=3055335 RepID=UPI002FD218C7
MIIWIKKQYKFYKIVLFGGLFIISIIFCFIGWGIIDSPLSCSASNIFNHATNQNIKVEIRSDGTTMVNNKPFFPFGFYHVSWRTTAKERIDALKDMAAAGFNTIHASATNLKDYGEFLDEAGRLGVYVLTEQNKIGLVNLVKQFKNKPAVLGWSIADDVDRGKFTPNDVLASHYQAKTIAPNHVTYVSGGSRKIEHFTNCSDIIAMQAYPLIFGKGRELSIAYRKILFTREYVKKISHKAVYANLQTFDWAVEEPENPKYKQGTRAPTFEEVRNMTYQAILAGAKGIIYYTYHDSVWNLPAAQPELWEKMKDLVPEIKAINSFVLNGNLKNLKSGDNNILTGIWQSGKEALAVVINTSFDRDSEVTIELPKNIIQANPMFTDSPASMSFKNGKLSGLIKPVEVQVYRLKG